ncbi:MAG: HlyC/CorC family transporter [Anaerolineae bacterium]|nr:HlyC/CorC family transporter [Anaerolineae bacterium]
MEESLLSIGIKLIAVVFLVLANGFFVATEFALVSVRRTRIDQLAEEGNRLAGVVQQALTHLDDYIAATQLGITMASLALGWIGEPALAHLLEPALAFLPTNLVGITSHTLAVAIAFSLITTLHIVIGELAPKTIALQRAEATSMMVALPIDIFLKVFRPFIVLMNSIGRGVVRLVGLQPASEHESVHSEEEIRMLLAASTAAGMIEQEEQAMIQSVFEFGDLTADQVMTPRTEMTAVPANMDLPQLVTLFTQTGHTRLPVYEGTLDNIVGVVHALDLLRVRQNGGPAPATVRGLMREVLTVPETLPLSRVLGRMKRLKTRVAILLDEYGGTAGLVTLEDLVERIVGDVQDEFDRPEEVDVQPLGDHVALVNGLMLLEDFNEYFRTDLTDEYNETVGGFVMGCLGRIPQVGDEVRAGSVMLHVEEMDGLRVARLRVEV